MRIADGYGEEEQKDYTVGAPGGEQEAGAPYGGEGEGEGEMPPASKDPIVERSERVRHRVMADPTPDRVDEVIEEVLQRREKEEERRTRMAEQKAFRAELRKQEEEKARRMEAEKEEEMAFMDMMQAREKAEAEAEKREQERTMEQDRT